MSADRCPRCGEPNPIGVQRVIGEQHYVVETIRPDGSLAVRAFEHEVVGHVGGLRLGCQECGHEWGTGRKLWIIGPEDHL